MTISRKRLLGALAAAALATLALPAQAQGMETPYSPDETGIALTPQEEAGEGFAARGGVRSPQLGGTVSVRGGRVEDVSAFPDSDTETNRVDE